MSHYLTLKGIGRPVAYFPKLGVYLDSVTAGVFLCQMIYWHDKATSELGVYKTSEEIQEETGLTYREQVTARKKLCSLGLIEETNKRLEHKIYFKFNESVFDEWLSGCLGIEIPERRKRISGNAENAIGRTTKTHFVLQENTQENTNTKTFSEKFEKFWSEYPKCKRKGTKEAANKTFTKYQKDFEMIMKVLDAFKKDEMWTKNNGEFIAAPSSWLNKQYWKTDYWIEQVGSVIESQIQHEAPRPQVKAIRKNYLNRG
ncbi:DNA replication protein [Acinetobacter phage Cato]|nr:DNA replication protein [Acinetobacter phage Cato]